MKEEKIRFLPDWLLGFIVIEFVMGLFLVFGMLWKAGQTSELLPVGILAMVFLIIIAILFHIKFSIKLENSNLIVQIVRISYKPLRVDPQDVVSWRIRPLKPFSEFGGYGKRRKKGVLAYVVDTRKALEIEVRKPGKIVISIKDTEGWEKALCNNALWAEKYRPE